LGRFILLIFLDILILLRHNNLMKFLSQSQNNIFDRKFFTRGQIRPKGFKIGIIVLIIISFFILNLTPISKNVREFFYFISSPVQKWLWERGSEISDFLEMILEMKNISQENENLKSENQSLLVKTVELEKLNKENDILRAALGLDLQEEFNLEISQVIGKDISEDYLIINKGIADGLSLNLPVINQEKYLIGKVSEVYNNTSKIQLLTSKDSSFDVEIFEKEIYVLAKGKGNLNIQLELIPRDKEINSGDKVLSSALGGNFPGGLLVGEVSKVKRSDTTSFQEAEITPFFNIEDLEYLFIIMNFSS
jgi:rod shape-determining protein MreC